MIFLREITFVRIKAFGFHPGQELLFFGGSKPSIPLSVREMSVCVVGIARCRASDLAQDIVSTRFEKEGNYIESIAKGAGGWRENLKIAWINLAR
jgi:hypothetical protein